MDDLRISRRSFLIGVSTAPVVLAACASSAARSASTIAPIAPTVSTTTSVSTPASAAPLPVPVLAPSPSPSTTPESTQLSSSVGDAQPPPTSTAPATTATPTTVAVTQTSAVPGASAVYIDHGIDTSDMVALTFHLSGTPQTVTALLDLLAVRSVAVTTFAVGTWITAHPEITRRVVADGHELGNHTEHHLTMSGLTRQQISDEIVRCGQAIVPFVGSIGRWFRPSATVVPDQVILDEAGHAGYPVSVGYDIDSVDNEDPGAAAIVANVNPHLHPGAIVSLHFGHAGTIDALPRILDELAARNLRPVTLSAMLG